MKTEYYRENRDLRKKTDDHMRRLTQKDRDKIAIDIERFLENGGDIQKIEFGIYSGACDLSEKQKSELRKKKIKSNLKKGGL